MYFCLSLKLKKISQDGTTVSGIVPFMVWLISKPSGKDCKWRPGDWFSKISLQSTAAARKKTRQRNLLAIFWYLSACRRSQLWDFEPLSRQETSRKSWGNGSNDNIIPPHIKLKKCSTILLDRSRIPNLAVLFETKDSWIAISSPSSRVGCVRLFY